MKYSFVLIAFNEQENIISCINSILAQDGLGDSYEIIVVDDGSRDHTSEHVLRMAAENPKIKLVSDGKNHGRGFGRFTGVNKSSGDFVIMVDADILLPDHWLQTCLENIEGHDVVGGIAVPDGDVAYIYRKFKLEPKTIMGSTTITGNNGMYKRKVFSKVTFDKNLREGEDVDFNHRASTEGFVEYCIPGLTVEHQESKSFVRSVQWLYQSGIGATRQLIRFREVRLPDLAFFATLLSTICAIILTILTSTGLWFLVPMLGLLGASFMHVRGKFSLGRDTAASNVGAILVDTLLIFSYYVGRLVGPFILLGRGKKK